MTQTHRLPGGLIDRNHRLTFQFNGQSFTGFRGDTLASALLANGQRLVGRSFKYHRPRGILSAGPEEPNALVTLHPGTAWAEPNTRATVTPLFDGLKAASQNHRGPLAYDLLSVNDLLSPFLGAGFYYKTFMWPAAFWEKVYEPIIRAAAGLGALSGAADPAVYDKGFLHCDVLVIGAGPAGIMAARTAADAGLRVILADEDTRAGGRLLAETHLIDDQPGHAWATAQWDDLAQRPNVRLLPQTTVYGAFDHGIYGALDRSADGAPDPETPRQVLWRIYTKQTILAAGATERPIAFPSNDRPGVMLAGGVRAYVNRFGVAPGQRVAVFTNNDDGLRTANDLEAQGIEITGVFDTRAGAKLVGTKGRKGLRAVIDGKHRSVPTECLAVAGGWSPNVHLTCHQRGRPVWRDDIAAFVPGPDLPPGMRVAGAANGAFTTAEALREGQAAALAAAEALGHNATAHPLPSTSDESAEITAFWHVKAKGRAWVDLQNDVTTKDVKQSHQEGFRSVEHLKRYTTLGMATDQGKTSNMLGLAVMAEVSGQSIAETGTTIFRPPYTPVPMAAFAGRAKGRDFRPTRLTPTHDWAAAHGATFVEVGPWMRAQWFAQPGEAGWRDSVDREVLAVRQGVGVCDVTTLGKIDIQGRDAATFLNRVYANGFAKLAIGKVRYGLMLREDGIVMDDGTTARFSETHFVMTTTTANAGAVFRHLEFARQCLWPDLDVHLISTTDAWAQLSVAGPKSRALLSQIVDLDLSNETFPFMACAECRVLGTPGRLFRISFSGELAYEIAVPARYGPALIAKIVDLGATPYGTEALGVMRIEKGHFAGNELPGQTTAAQLGVGRMVSQKKDSIGMRLAQRPAMTRDDDLRLMGFRPVDRSAKLDAGAHFVNADDRSPDMDSDQGWMTSVAYSPELGHHIGLGFLKRGQDRLGEVVRAYDPARGKDTKVEVVSPHHIDPEGERQRA
ncbi:MAG: sarcosine oxidase subunit alpha family protein [Pseudomonadota bacterium]